MSCAVKEGIKKQSRISKLEEHLKAETRQKIECEGKAPLLIIPLIN